MYNKKQNHGYLALPPPAERKKRGAGGWKEEAQTSGWVDQVDDYLNVLAF